MPCSARPSTQGDPPPAVRHNHLRVALPLQEVAGGPPAGFTLTEAKGDTLMSLSKEHRGERVTVNVMVNEQVRGLCGAVCGAVLWGGVLRCRQMAWPCGEQPAALRRPCVRPADRQQGGLRRARAAGGPACIQPFASSLQMSHMPFILHFFGPPFLQPEEELVEDESGAIDADVGALFTATVTKGGRSLV